MIARLLHLHELLGRTDGPLFTDREGGHTELDGRRESGKEGEGQGKEGRSTSRTSSVGTQGGAPPQACVLQRESPPFWSGHGDERRKRGRGQGKERPLCHNGKGSGNGLGRGLVAAGRRSVDHGKQQQQARSHVRAAGVGEGAGQGQAAERRRHNVPRPVHPPHRQQRGAGAVE